MAELNLLNTMNRVEVPFIKVTIGEYTFGVFQKSEGNQNIEGVYQAVKITYPNFVKSLTINKTNGDVNEYDLTLVYVIRPGDDPNFFEKVFSSVSDSRKIIFSYGDMNAPNYIYKDEEAIITDVSDNFDVRSPIISYTVHAVSSGKLASSGAYSFPPRKEKPSVVIKEILYSTRFGLTTLFYGMVNKEQVDSLGLIAGDDAVVNISGKVNMSPLNYLQYFK